MIYYCATRLCDYMPMSHPASSSLPTGEYLVSILGFYSHLPSPSASGNAQVLHRSAVINIGLWPTSNVSMYKDDFGYQVRSSYYSTRPPPPILTQRQYSSSVFNPLSGSTSNSTIFPADSSSPTSPRSVRSRTSLTVHEDILAPGDLVGEGRFHKSMFSAGSIRHLSCRATSHPHPTGCATLITCWA